MLDPNIRQLYLSALKPPSGYSFDRAIGTTFTLDLFTLFAIPLSFAKFEFKNRDDLLRSPISVLEALRRLTGKFFVFCQRGQIKVPSSMNPLLSYLEKMIIEVSPPNPEGIFHPKVWVLRFVNDQDKKIIYRFLCLSRNITFDKSWDTILVLEGVVKGSFYARNRALSDFLMKLPFLAKKKPSKQIWEDIKKIAEEVRHADFKQPEGFYDDFRFWPIGIPKYKEFPIQDDYWRILVVSPFLTNGMIGRLAANKKENILISRDDSLNDMSPETLDKFKEIYFMDDNAYKVDEIREETLAGKSKKENEDSELSGLHAKLYLTESGWDASLWTGSANATNAAFDDFNVEFLVELRGKKSKIGINKFMAQRKGITSMPDLLIEYEPAEVSISEREKTKKELERKLDNIRRQVSNLNLRIVVVPSKIKNFHDLNLYIPGKLKYLTNFEVDGKCWPISLKDGLAQKLSFLKLSSCMVFHEIPTEKITSFMAFELSGKYKYVKQSIRFVLNLPIQGIPKYRNEKILQTIVSNRENFLRYLLMLLSEGEFAYFVQDLENRLERGRGDRQKWISFEDMPLFEELVRAFSRDPEKIQRISMLVEDVSKMEGGKKILPAGFKELWETFKKAKKLKV